MYNQVLLSAAVAGLASTVGATYNHAAANQLRDLTQPAHVVPRQPAQSGSSDCVQSAMKLFTELPQPTGALLSYYESATAEITATAVPTDLGQVCAMAATESIPSSLSAPLSSYESTPGRLLMSVCSADPIVKSAEQLLAQITKEPACSSLLASATGALATPTATGSGSGSGSGSSAGAGGAAQTSSPSQAAAPKATGLVAGAVAAAGFLGAVAML
ncbi:hypothetical protein PG997_010696 [Apiospora hydei]|uniref:Infection structure specific protein n=1 Tax=Apiospora hydei TaxID=1337664 RepID=A0ABR1VH27_9PEZI